jgi:lysophospholipase L1-like esterase
MGNALRRLKRVLAILQTAWSILGITMVMLFLAEGGFRLIFTVRDRIGTKPVPDPRVLVEGYAGANWPVEHYRELELLEERWQPYVYFRQKAFRGKTITVGADGVRATWQPPASETQRPEHGTVKVLLLGGSSLWGFGARDDQTIPSLLARSLHDQGWRVELNNLSEIGYVSTQELIALLRELQGGYRPDVVIFYDGVNDVTSALLEGEAALTTNEVNRRGEFNLLQSPVRLAAALIGKVVKDSGSYRFAQMVRRRLSGATAPSHPTPAANEMDKLAEDVVRRFEANVTLAASLGRSFGFRPLFFWQPTVFTKPSPVLFEREEAQRYAWAEPMFRNVDEKVQRSAQLKADRAFRDLSGVFEGWNGLAFIDYCHTTESANARIAAKMAEGVIRALRRSSAHGRDAGRQDGTSGPQRVE